MADPEKAMDASPNKDAVPDIDASESAHINTAAEYIPEILSSLKRKLTVDGTLAPCMINLPRSVKRRVKALKKLQLDCVNLEAKFYQEMHSLECKYEKLYTSYYEKRSLIVNGAIEVTDEDCDFPSDTEKEFDMCAEIEKVKLEEEQNKDNELKMLNEDTKGIPEFWLTTFKNVDMINEMIQEYDEPILKHLTDVVVTLSDIDSKPAGFTLEFFFEPNEYFTNQFLAKHYEMKFTPDPMDPFSFDGPEIVKCKGFPIDWKKGKNVTIKTIKKKQKHKARGAVRTVTKTVQNDSFFNFFNPPAVPEDEEQMDEETRSTLALDFDVGNFLKDRIVPRAVLYFTGEAISDDEYDEEEEDEEEEEFDEDEEEEEDDETEQQQVTNPSKGRKIRTPQSVQQSQQQPPECKQQ